MLTRCQDLSSNDQKIMMDKLRKWKSTAEARKIMPFSAPSSDVLGRGLTPATYAELLTMHKKVSSAHCLPHDYLIKSGDVMVGMIGYKRVFINPETQVVSFGLYVINFDGTNGFTMIKALRKIYEEMIDNSDEIVVTAVNRDRNEGKDPFKTDVIDKYRVLDIRETRHVDCDYNTHIGTQVVIKGRLKEKGA